MKITVITVSFNSAETIGDTLDSVNRQDYDDFEHLIIDGASRDTTLSVVREHASPLTRVYSEPDNGIYDAMNKGLHLARGDVVGFLNADDMLASPHTLAHVAAAAADADIVYGDLVYVDKDRPDRLIRYWRSGAFRRNRLRFGWMPPHPTFYLRRSVLQSVGLFDTALRIAADYDFMLRCLAQRGLQVAYLPEVLVHMRTGGASNRSLAALRNKSREDLRALRKNGVGGWLALLCKNGRKLPQFALRPRSER